MVANSEANSGPLAGIRVIDVSRVLAGPFCGQMLADMGADVLKVEMPGGDENRGWAPIIASGESSNFMSVNRGKRGITLNLKSEQGRAILDRLLADADVVLHNFLPSTAARLGLDADEIRTRYPELIFCSLSAFGAKGPMRDRPGYEAVMQAFSGIMGITGEPTGGPVRSGVSFVDLTTGILAYAGVLTALYDRKATGKGRHVTGSLFETAVTLLGYHAMAWLEGGVLPHREGSGIWHIAPYQAFGCSDGYVFTGALNDHTWPKLCAVVGRTDLSADPALKTNLQRVERRVELRELFQSIFATATVAEWVERLEAGGVPVSPLHTIDQLFTHEQTLANDMLVTVGEETGDTLRMLGLPFKLGGDIGPSLRRPPKLSEHTQDILHRELDLSLSEIERLRSENVI